MPAPGTDGDAALLEEHLPLVRHVVLQVAARFPRHVDREELVRAGTLGLVEAARRYDDGRGVPFARFAAQRIRGAVLDAVRAADWAPRSVRSVARTLEAAERSLTATLGRPPSRQELATELGLPLEEVEALQRRIHRSLVLTLDHPTAGDEDRTLGDSLVDDSSGADEVLERQELHGYLRDAIELLPERHRLVVAGYFLDGRTSEDLAAALGVTTSRVSQLRTEAVEMLREGIDAQYATAAPAVGCGRVARRKAAYAEAIRQSSDWRRRVSA